MTGLISFFQLHKVYLTQTVESEDAKWLTKMSQFKNCQGILKPGRVKCGSVLIRNQMFSLVKPQAAESQQFYSIKESIFQSGQQLQFIKEHKEWIESDKYRFILLEGAEVDEVM